MLGQILAALLLAITALAAPVVEAPARRSTCSNPILRKEWRTLSNDEKKAYLDAEVCLMGKNGTLGLRAGRTKFDEFQSVHVYQSEIAHFVGQFFPFHRMYVWAHEQTLRKECGYKGAQPYWAEELDVGAFEKSPIFAADHGFGGDGHGDQLCVTDGPFKDYVNTMGPGYKLQEHCIQRKINNNMTWFASKTVVDNCMNQTTFATFWFCVETSPHGAGHGGVGAGMSNPVSSPGDPLFFLHHAWLDRMWAKWQAKDPKRLEEIGGNNKATRLPGTLSMPMGPNRMDPFGDPKDLVRPADVPAPKVMGDPGNQTTLTHVIEMYGIVPDSTVGDVMDTKGSLLCYEYD